MSEWLRTVAARTGLASDARVLACQLGGRESRVEMEISFDSLAELDAFFAALPAEQHAAWSARLAATVVDGSPHWTVLRTLPLGAEPLTGASRQEEAQAAPPPPPMRRTAGGLYVPDASAAGDEPATAETVAVELDWKGDPMVRRPGDMLPRIV